MNRCFMVTALLLVLCTGNTHAQLVPLELDQTITLPQGSATSPLGLVLNNPPMEVA